METFKILSLNNFSEWQKYIEELPIEKRDIYITPEYYKLYENNENGSPKCIIYKKNNNICIFPFLINKINTSNSDISNSYFDLESAYGYSGMIFNTSDIKFIDNFFIKLQSYLKKQNIVICFIRFNPFQKIYSEIKKNIQIIKDRETVYLDINIDYENIFHNVYTSNNRNMIRKSNKKYYSVIGNNDKQMKFFLNNYYETLLKLNADKFYYFNEDYFNNFVSTLNKNSFFVNVFNNKNECKASSLILKYENYAHYHLSAKSLKSDDNSITNFMIDEVVKYLKKSSCKFLHLGGGRTNNKEDTLLKFKKNFSKSVLEYYIGKLVVNKKIYDEINYEWEQENQNKLTKYNNYILKYRY